MTAELIALARARRLRALSTLSHKTSVRPKRARLFQRTAHAGTARLFAA
jgi:hypothetical protein